MMEGNMRPVVVGCATNENNEQEHQMPKPIHTGPESSSPPGMQEVPRLGVRVPDFGLAEVVAVYMQSCTGLLPHLKTMSGPSNQSKKVFGSASNSNHNQATRNNGASTLGKGNRIAHQVPSSSHGETMRRVDKSLDNVQAKMKIQANTSDVRKTATKVHGAIGRQLMKPKKIVPRAKRRSSQHTPQEISKFEARFAINPHPTPTQVHEICAEINKTPREVKRWFLMHRKKMGVGDKLSPGPSTPVANPNAGQGNQSRLIFEQTGNQATVSGEQSNPTVSSDTHEERPSRIKYLRDPSMRTLNREVITKDIENVKLCDLTEFRRILDGLWNVKANRLLRLLLQKKTDYCHTIHKEARRINNVIVARPFSASQYQEIVDWKDRFLDDACFAHGVTDIVQVNHLVDEAIIPWIAPFIYSKTTMQDGRYLTLEVALSDFCTISPQGGQQSWEWKTPLFLQYDNM